MTEYCGQCLCGNVRYTVKGPPVIVAKCHCDECRRLSGTGHSLGAMFPAAALTLTGQTATYTYTSAKGSQVTRAFCPTCGSPVFGQNTQSPDHLTLPLGTMDDAQKLAVEVVIFERDKPHWDQLAPGVMSFATQPDWSPES